MGNKIYPSIKNSIFLCLIVMGIQFGLSILLGIFQLKFNITQNSTLFGILSILISLISFGIVILIGFKKTKRKFNEVFKFNRVSPVFWITGTIIIIGLSVVVSELDNLLNFVLPMPEWIRDFLSSLMKDQSLIISLFYIGLAAAFSEELFFRGLILDGFAINYSKKKAIIISSLLFGLIHLNPWQFVGAFIIGLVLAYICIETKSILLCIYMHFLNNAGATLMVRYNDVITIKGYNTIEAHAEFQPLWFTLSGLFLLIIGMTVLFKLLKKQNMPQQDCGYTDNGT